MDEDEGGPSDEDPSTGRRKKLWLAARIHGALSISGSPHPSEAKGNETGEVSSGDNARLTASNQSSSLRLHSSLKVSPTHWVQLPENRSSLFRARRRHSSMLCGSSAKPSLVFGFRQRGSSAGFANLVLVRGRRHLMPSERKLSRTYKSTLPDGVWYSRGPL